MAARRQSQPWRQRLSYKRKSKVLETRKKYLIVTEGATEAGYFRQFNCYPTLLVEVLDGQDNKRSLVEKTIEERDRLVANEELILGKDEVWVVFDRDDDPRNKKDKDNFNQAIQVANNNQINLAYSNDAVELWFLLHFQEVSTSMHRKDLNASLSKHLSKKYEKAQGKEIFSITKDLRPKAIKRAKALHAAAKDMPPCDANPSTLVYKLVEKIIKEDGFRET